MTFEISADTHRLRLIRDEIVNHEERLKILLKDLEGEGFARFTTIPVFTKAMDEGVAILERQIGQNICKEFANHSQRSST